MTTPSILNTTPPILFNVKYIPSVPQKPSSCTNGQKNNLQKAILNHLNPHMPQALSASRRKMDPITQYRTIGPSTTGPSETNIPFRILNTLPRNSKDTYYSLSLTSGLDITMSVSVQETSGRPLSALRKDIGNPRSCTLGNAMHPPPSSELSINSYNPLKTNIQG